MSPLCWTNITEIIHYLFLLLNHLHNCIYLGGDYSVGLENHVIMLMWCAHSIEVQEKGVTIFVNE